MNEKGLTLLEATIALFLLGIVMTGMVPSFLAFTDVNTQNEVRSEAIQAAQMEMEALRTVDLSTVTTTPGTYLTRTVTVGARDYDVEIRKCMMAGLCDTDGRHFVVEVKLDGQVYYTAETVFTPFR